MSFAHIIISLKVKLHGLYHVKYAASRAKTMRGDRDSIMQGFLIIVISNCFCVDSKYRGECSYSFKLHANLVISNDANYDRATI